MKSSKNGVDRLVNNVLTPEQRKRREWVRNFYVPKPPIKPNPKTADTIERESLHSRIKELISQGKGNIEILATLSSEFPDSKLQPFFEKYIEHHRQKIVKTTKKVEKGRDDE